MKVRLLVITFLYEKHWKDRLTFSMLHTQTTEWKSYLHHKPQATLRIEMWDYFSLKLNYRWLSTYCTYLFRFHISSPSLTEPRRTAIPHPCVGLWTSCCSLKSSQHTGHRVNCLRHPQLKGERDGPTNTCTCQSHSQSDFFPRGVFSKTEYCLTVERGINKTYCSLIKRITMDSKESLY